jgi:hypothetical protein
MQVERRRALTADESFFGDDCRRVRLSNSFVGSSVLHKRGIIDGSSNSSWVQWEVDKGQGCWCGERGHGCPTEAQLGASQLHHAADALAWGAIERDSTVQPAETPQSRNTGPAIIAIHTQSVQRQQAPARQLSRRPKVL